MRDINNLQRFKDRIAAGQVCVGAAITFVDPAVSELFGDAGYDFIWIDTEHCPLGLQETLGHIMAARGTGCAPFVRVPSNDPVRIKPVLDLAPAAIIVPFVQTPADVELAVQACKYPPRGIRGYAPRRGAGFGGIPQMDYLEFADRQTMVIVQIEHIEAVRNIDAILATPDLDGICLGPNDLSGSLGRLGRVGDPEVVKAIDTVLEKARRTDLLIGVATGYTPQTLSIWLEKGIQWICLNTDYSNMYQQARLVLDAVRQADATKMKSEKP